MSASNRPNHIYLVMDAGTPVAAFTARPALQVYLRHRIDTFINPLVYTFWGKQGPVNHDHVVGAVGMRAGARYGRGVSCSGSVFTWFAPIM